MLDPKSSLTFNLLNKLSNAQERHRQLPTPVRFFGSLVTSITATLDSLHHLIACIVKVVTGFFATPYQILNQSTALNSWTWKAASKHFLQAVKHLALIFVSPVYTFVFLPKVALHSFYSVDHDETNPLKQNKFLLERVTEQQSKIIELNQKLKQNTEKESETIAETNRTHQAKIDSLNAKLKIAEVKLGLNTTAIEQKDALITSLKAGKLSAPQPQIYNQILNEKESQIKAKEALITEKSLTIDRLNAEITPLIETINGIAGELLCPLSFELFNEPVTLVPCGHRFEKTKIVHITTDIAEKNNLALKAKKLNENKANAVLAEAEKIRTLCPCCRSEFTKFQEDTAIRNSTLSIRNINALLLEQGKKGIEVLS